MWILLDPYDVPFKFFHGAWGMSEFINKEIEPNHPDIVPLLGLLRVSGWRKYWYLFKYPHLKIQQ